MRATAARTGHRAEEAVVAPPAAPAPTLTLDPLIAALARAADRADPARRLQDPTERAG